MGLIPLSGIQRDPQVLNHKAISHSNGQETNAPGFVPANVTQSVSGASYSFNGDGSATLRVPANPLFTGTKTVFASPDGNFILGWTPGGLDIFFGVKALAAGTGTNGISQGIYFTAGFDVAGMLQKRPLVSPDFYFGTYHMMGNANGDALVQQVTNLPLGGVTAITWDFSTNDQIVLNPDGTAGPDALGYSYAFGAGGQGFVAIGTQGIFGLVVGVRAAEPAAAAGVYINPAMVVNAASYQPVIAGRARGVDYAIRERSGIDYDGSGRGRACAAELFLFLPAIFHNLALLSTFT